jgi:hypothetical protein
MNELLSWYAAHRPGEHFTIRVPIAVCTARKLCRQKLPPFTLLGHTIVPTKWTAHCGGVSDPTLEQIVRSSRAEEHERRASMNSNGEENEQHSTTRTASGPAAAA